MTASDGVTVAVAREVAPGREFHRWVDELLAAPGGAPARPRRLAGWLYRGVRA